jgi:hypothetical protein
MIAIFGRLLFFAIRLTWGMLKVAFSLVLLPLGLVGLVLRGLIRIALPVLIVVGIISLLTVPSRN